MGCNNTKKTSLKKLFLLCILCILPLFLLNGWQSNFQDLYRSTPQNLDSSGNLTLLLWYWPFNRSLSLEGDVCWDAYRVPGCRLTTNRSLYSAAHVVVFHNRELMIGAEQLPLDLPRPPGQRWAWMSLEAPLYNGKLQKYANTFNLTVTYRKDGDVSVPYGERLPREPKDEPVSEIPRNKSALVCWVVSNYRKSHKRSQVYHQLRHEVPVSVYGRMTKKPLGPDELLPTISRCYFYLAFENAISKDYITEKLWRNAYEGNAVPVVLGPPLQNYQALAPPHSFIHVDEFASVKELGKHLQRLAGDEVQYRKYFDWRQEWKVKRYADWRERLCKICSEYPHFPKYKVYTDLEAWVNNVHI